MPKRFRAACRGVSMRRIRERIRCPCQKQKLAAMTTSFHFKEERCDHQHIFTFKCDQNRSLTFTQHCAPQQLVGYAWCTCDRMRITFREGALSRQTFLPSNFSTPLPPNPFCSDNHLFALPLVKERATNVRIRGQPKNRGRYWRSTSPHSSPLPISV